MIGIVFQDIVCQRRLQLEQSFCQSSRASDRRAVVISIHACDREEERGRERENGNQGGSR